MVKSARYLLVYAFCLTIFLCFVGVAYADDISTGGEYNLARMKAPVRINTTEAVTLKGKLGGAIDCVVKKANLTLKSVSVSGKNGCALTFTGADNTLILEGKNTLKSGAGSPGIRVEEGTGLTIKGEGSLTATGGDNGAGIGGGDCAAGGSITIQSGKITAKGGYNAAGIGGGSCRGGGTTILSGGTVTATGGLSGAGIGGGGDNSGGTILISGGTVKAAGSKGGGSGIGCGWTSGSRVIQGGAITITGGNITATGGSGSCGIGGGVYGNCGIITIEGGTVKATGKNCSCGIGGGNQSGNEGSIIISGGTIESKTLVEGPGIWAGSDITISGGDIKTTGADCGAGISAGNSIAISGGTIVAIGGAAGAGIGTAFWGGMESITISGGNITATGGNPKMVWGERQGGGAGIGGSFHSSSCNITVSGGTVKATGGDEGAGIGIGSSGSGGNIILSGGRIEATGGRYGAGIGGGLDGASCNTVITGNSLVYARHGKDAEFDIGAGAGGQNVQLCLIIEKNAAVFLETDSSAPVFTKSHKRKTPGDEKSPMIAKSYDGTKMIFGIEGTGISPWTDARGGYFIFCDVQYHLNGGEGVLPESPGSLHVSAAIPVAGGDEIHKDGYTFSGWNRRPGGSGKWYLPGETFTVPPAANEVTLYAQWKPLDQSNSAQTLPTV